MLRSKVRIVIAEGSACPEPFFDPLVQVWRELTTGTDRLPAYADFHPAMLPGRLMSHIILCKLIGKPRRFFYEVVGDYIERNNGFSARKKFLSEIPLKNRRVMAREFAMTLRALAPVYSRGPYIGQADFVRGIERVLTPYRISENEYAFVGAARFSTAPGDEWRLT